MILLDSIFVNQGGGAVLLKLLVKRFEQENLDVYYLFDERVKEQFEYLPEERKCFLPGSFIKRHQFYSQNKDRFSTVFCFGNLPPSVKQKEKVKVYTYFQNVLYFGMSRRYDPIERFSYLLRRLMLRLLSGNTTEFWVQTEEVKQLMSKKLSVSKEKIKIQPFFEDVQNYGVNKMAKEKEFMYLSEGYPHKNVNVLLEAWELLFSKGINLKLHLTVSKNYNELIREVDRLNRKGLQIKNHEQCNPEELFRICRYQVYPSIRESFGLGLIESVQHNTEVIGVDLPYLYAVIDPLIVFQPDSATSIAECIEKVVLEDGPDSVEMKTKLKVSNRLEEMVNKLMQSEKENTNI